ncbi:hypothetical protein [Halobacillus litoralis]|uniref:hypothetical protein n=1 Tax=Halobacillus litoralis TaxID=45668 RepID=UPI0023430845|nr:hypothetical protein [Halobacillus litoralis]
MLLSNIFVFVETNDWDQVKFNKWLATFLALIVGIGTGIVGGAGAFSSAGGAGL